MGKFYTAVVQSVLLYGSETWVLSEKMRRMLEGFHNRCARQMMKRFIHPDLENEQNGEANASQNGEAILNFTVIPLKSIKAIPLHRSLIGYRVVYTCSLCHESASHKISYYLVFSQSITFLKLTRTYKSVSKSSIGFCST
jgi:hypothetical protein